MANNKICFTTTLGTGLVKKTRKICLPLFLEKFDPFHKIPPIDQNKELLKWVTEQGLSKELVTDLVVLKVIDSLMQQLSPNVLQKVQPYMGRAFRSVPLPRNIKLAFEAVSSPVTVESVQEEMNPVAS